MTRVAVILFGVLGLTLAAAGMFVAVAAGLPALGLNPYGRPPLDQTFGALGTALMLYAIGGALLASAARWIRHHRPGVIHIGSLAYVGVVAVAVTVWMVARRDWVYVPIMPLFAVGLVAPIILGVWSRGNQPRQVAVR